MLGSNGRLFAISDIHGCLPALESLLTAISPQPEDTIVTLGDYIDRGPQSREVLERLMALREQCRLVPLLGNHDQMMLMVHGGRRDLFTDWLLFGGSATMKSYGIERPEDLPNSHIIFLQSCQLCFEADRHFFLHGNYQANVSLDKQPPNTVLWESLKARQPGPHQCGKKAIVGHTAQKNGEILDLGYLKCIDTCCYGEGWLTAMELPSGKVWQANKLGQMRY
jgi:serine/threonine protein phosphatase 1